MYIMTHEKLLDTREGAFGRKKYLIEVMPCDNEPAGSGVRVVPHMFRAASDIAGCRHSKAFKTLEDAKTEFERLTTPIIAQTI